MTELETLRAENTRLSEALKTEGEKLREARDAFKDAQESLENQYCNLTFYYEERTIPSQEEVMQSFNADQRARSALSRIEGVGK